MNNKKLPEELLYDALQNLIFAVSRKWSANRYYAELRFIIGRIKDHNFHQFPDRKIEDDDRIAAIEKAIDALQEADEIIAPKDEHQNADAIRHALDLYNQALQEDKLLNIRGLSVLLAKRIKRASNILNVLLSETSKQTIYEENRRKSVNKIQFITQALLTPNFLLEDLAPWLKAIVELQNVFDDFQNKEKREVRILSITQRSPVNVNLEGGGQAIQAIEEAVVPWRQEHAKKLAEIDEQSKLLALQQQKAEIEERRANAAKARSESFLIREEARRKKIENDLLAELLRSDLAVKIAKDTLHLIREADIEHAVDKMLPSLVTLATSNLDIGKTELNE